MKTTLVKLALSVCLSLSVAPYHSHLKTLPSGNPYELDLYISFETVVDKLRLRAAPSPTAAILAELPEGTILEYLHQSGGEVMETALRGSLHKGRWHKVSFDDGKNNTPDKIGWVFAGGLALQDIYGEGEGMMDKIQYDFLSIKKISKANFEAQKTFYKNDFVDDLKDHQVGENTFLMRFDNGLQRMMTDSICSWRNADGPDPRRYVGQYPSAGLYLIYGSCEHGEIYNEFYSLVDKSNGTSYGYILNGDDIPVLSPDKKWLVDSFSADCGAVTGISFAVKDNKGWRTAFSLTMSDQIADEIVWTDKPNEVWLEWQTIKQRDNDEDLIITNYYKLTFEWPL